MSKDNVRSVTDSHVVILNNYIRRHHVLAYKALEKEVGKLTILLSTEMEPDRSWEAEWNGLDVQVQKNWTYTGRWRHSSGFEEPNYIHFPIDTASRLRKLKPDIVFSYELGVRTLLCSWFRMWNRQAPLVMVGNMSEHIEKERGIMRRMLRSTLIRSVDYCTYNGPSCKRYLENLGFDDDQLFHIPYCFDAEATWTGEKSFSDDNVLRLVYCGAISTRKGILEFTGALRKCVDALASQNKTNKDKTRKVALTICGEGELRADVAAFEGGGLSIEFAGNCDSQQLRQAYRQADICAFPTFADEWGLVPVEAMNSGVPVLGSRFAQSMEELGCEGENGWLFSPSDSNSMEAAIMKSLTTSRSELIEMGTAARSSVQHITPQRTADAFVSVIKEARLKHTARRPGRVSEIPAS